MTRGDGETRSMRDLLRGGGRRGSIVCIILMRACGRVATLIPASQFRNAPVYAGLELKDPPHASRDCPRRRSGFHPVVITPQVATHPALRIAAYAVPMDRTSTGSDPRPRVLVIDDDPALLRMVKLMLKEDGFEVLT